MANEDYLAGTTRLLDAMLTFFCISLGVALAFMLDENLFGEILPLDPLIADPQTSSFFAQLIAAFLL